MLKKIRKMRDHGGFTMIEMAVVLVIIGLILASVMSGKDIVDNSKARQFSQWVKSWENAVLQFRDQKGYFPGDGSAADVTNAAANGRMIENFLDTTNGIIADEAAGNSLSGVFLTQMYIDDAPADKITIGSYHFWVKLGNDSGLSPVSSILPGTDDTKGVAIAADATTSDPDKNIIVVCATVDCTLALPAETLAWFGAFDASIDGQQDAAAGRVRAITVPLVPGAATNCAAAGLANAAPYFVAAGLLVKRKRVAGAFLTLNEAAGCVDEVTEHMAAAAAVSHSYSSEAHFGMVYYFDRAP